MHHPQAGRTRPCPRARRQRGFTLIELSIVLIVAGLVVSTSLVAREMLHGARVKGVAAEFAAVRTAIDAYQDRFHALPGDDPRADAHLPGALVAANAGNQVLDGRWDSTNPADDSVLLWQHLRLAALLAGATDPADPGYRPRNRMEGRMGVSAASAHLVQVAGLNGAFQVCSGNLPGRLAKALDILLDDGDTAAGTLRFVPEGSPPGAAAVPTAAVGDGASFIACQAF